MKALTKLDAMRKRAKRARDVTRVRRSHAPRKPRKPHPHRHGPYVTKRRMLKAIPNTGGVKSRIAEALGVGVGAVCFALKREGWDEVRQAYQEECDRVADLAEETIHHAIEQRLDLPEATKNARWYLTRKARDRGYGDVSKVKLVGGDTGDQPVRVTQESIPLESLELPLEVRRLVLEAAEARAEEGGPASGHDDDEDEDGDEDDQ